MIKRGHALGGVEDLRDNVKKSDRTKKGGPPEKEGDD